MTMIPSIIWPSTIQQEIGFYMQKFLCIECIKETPSDHEVPESREVVFVDGTTYCFDHARQVAVLSEKVST